MRFLVMQQVFTNCSYTQLEIWLCRHQNWYHSANTCTKQINNTRVYDCMSRSKWYATYEWWGQKLFTLRSHSSTSFTLLHLCLKGTTPRHAEFTKYLCHILLLIIIINNIIITDLSMPLLVLLLLLLCGPSLGRLHYALHPVHLSRVNR